MITVDEIRRALNSRIPLRSPSESRTHAAVALVVKEEDEGLSILFIERAHHENDPWSGDLGFPGGKVEEDDDGAQGAAVRETMEEIGLDLSCADCLGQLDDIAGAHLPVHISCYVWSVRNSPSFTLSHEVSAAFWFPMKDIVDPSRHGEFTVRFRNKSYLRPAIRILEPGRTVLWGITYRLVMQFLGIIGHSPSCTLIPDAVHNLSSADP